MLVTEIEVSALLSVVATATTGYSVVAFNIDPIMFSIAPGRSQLTLGELVVPEAFVGAEGEYTLNPIMWKIESGPDDWTTVTLQGTVTYSTVSTCFTTTTNQDIVCDYTYEVNGAGVPVDATLEFEGDAPDITLAAELVIGPQPGVNYAASGKWTRRMGPVRFTQTTVNHSGTPHNIPAKRA